jgi:MoaA/NifB/PqqE/SkfB family radical SAM enzyme
MDNNFFQENHILELTNQCNNNCLICQDRIKGQKKINRNFSQLKKEIDYFVSRGAKNISIYGGEPYLNRNIDKVLEYINQLNLSCDISTNGRIFSYQPLVKKLAKLKKILVITTLFSYKESVHNYLTAVSGSYQQTIKGIKNLIKFNIPVAVTITLTKKNVKDLLKTVEFLNQLKVRRIKISGLVNQGGMIKRPELVPSFSLVKAELTKALERTRNRDVWLSFEKLPFCLAPAMARKFKYEAQHRKTMLICPKDSKQCLKCSLKANCMCYKI